MELKLEQKDWIFLLLCFLVGLVAEEAFLMYQIGISYFVFIVFFYSLFFWRFRSFNFSHQRFGYLLLISIWILAACYTLYDTALFYMLNIVVIPTLVIFHLVLITSPKKFDWSNLVFIKYILHRIVDGIRYNAIFLKYVSKLSKQNSNQKHYDVWKKILIGIGVSIPLLAIILTLLISADTEFARILSSIPNFLTFRGDLVFRFIIVLIYTFLFFGFMQVLLQRKMDVIYKNGTMKPLTLDGVITLTILLLLDLVYILFVVVQFKYFFSGTLEDGYTYAEYARRGFFELLFVTMINLTVTITVIYSTKIVQGLLKKTIRFALAVLVLSSGVILISAFMRMMMYEDAYGFTFLRVLVHSFMIFLMVILAYTLVKIWLEQLSLFHFYFIAALIYYVGINFINLDSIVVKQNITRYEETGKIDINYLNSLSSTGILGLIELYEKNPHVQGLEELLQQRKQEKKWLKSEAWQSYNLAKNRAYQKLGELNL
ncbi:MAG TPA: DUF4173 domain-containing protein [Bacillus bacterium]|nr:DUF4173 domain-containing protein [Bacillus sp. (in: firmicutes)]